MVLCYPALGNKYSHSIQATGDLTEGKINLLEKFLLSEESSKAHKCNQCWRICTVPEFYLGYFYGASESLFQGLVLNSTQFDGSLLERHFRVALALFLTGLFMYLP